MAVIETWIKTDLKSIVKVNMFHGILFSQDNMANLIGVELLEGGQPATVTGSVSANVLRADGTTVAVAGTLSGNKASVTLPQAAYAVPGMLAVVIKLTDSSTVTTIGAIQSIVYRASTDTIIDPGTIIPSVQDLIAAIDAAVDSIPPDYSALTAEVGDLKNAIDDISTHTKNLFTGVIEQGNMKYGVNSDDLASYFVRTQSYTEINENTVYTISFISPMNAALVFFYDSDKQYLSNSGTIYSGSEGSSIQRAFVFTSVANAKYIKFKANGGSGSVQYNPSQITNVQVETGSTATEYVKPYTAYDKIARADALEAKANTSKIPFITGYTSNVFIDNEIEQGNINSSGAKTDTTYAYFVRTKNYIEIENNKSVTISLKSPANKIKAFFYNSAYEYISSVEETLGTEGTAYKHRRVLTTTAPATAKYLMFKVFGSAGTNTYTPNDVSNVEVNIQAYPNPEYNNPITAVDSIARENKYIQYASGNILCLGDSLTAGYYANQSAQSGSIEQNYPYYLKRMLNAEVTNEGVSGATPSTWLANNPNYDYSPFDTIIIWFGTNGGLSVDDVETPGTRTYAYDQLLTAITTSNPDCKIILATVFVTGPVEVGSEPYSADVTNTAIRGLAVDHNCDVIELGDLVYANNPIIHTSTDKNHFTKGGNIYVAYRFVEYMSTSYNLSNVEFGLTSV